jgi:tetratricopeptide (TPR) repeat protein
MSERNRKANTNIGSLLDEGMRRHMAGDLAGAAGLYERVLKVSPDNADALNLLGVAALQGGAPDRAAALLRRAVALDGRHPGYLNNLGQALDAQGEVAAALDSYRAALALAPGDPRCLNNIGLALSRMGDFAGALEAATAAAEADPSNSEYHHNVGATLLDMGRADEAQAALERALALNPGQADSYSSLGLLLANRGDTQNAVACCMRATEIEPLNVEGHEACRKLLWDIGDAEHMNASYIRACERHPDVPETFVNLGTALIECQEPAEAAAALQRALTLDPRNAAALSRMGAALSALGRYDEAIAAHRAAIAADGGVAAYHEALGDTYATRKEFDRAAAAYRAAHERNPRRSGVLGALTTALNEIGDPTVGKLVDYDRFVTTRILEPPGGFDSIEAFNAALHDELVPQHVPRPHPIGQTMRGGTQNKGHLFNGAGGLVGEVRDMLRAALRSYIRSLDVDPDDPFLRFANENIRFTGAWSTILPESAYDESHIHNEGWISGVYYVKTPEIEDGRWAEGEGCIQFGRPPKAFESNKNIVRRRVRPRSGMAVFFPSYYWHGVEPFHQAGTRHSIAFDAR